MLGLGALMWGMMGGCALVAVAAAEEAPVAEAVEELGTFNADVNRDARYFIYLESASWCGYCRNLMPKVVEEYEALKAAGVEVILVGADRSAEESESYLGEYGAQFPGVFGDEAQNLPGFESSNGVPWICIVDAKGNLLKSGVGGALFPEWRSVISEAEEGNVNTEDGEVDDSSEAPGAGSDCEGGSCDAPGAGSDCEGDSCEAPGASSASKGSSSEAPGAGSECEGDSCEAPGAGNECEGDSCEAPGAGNECEGDSCEAPGADSEGDSGESEGDEEAGDDAGAGKNAVAKALEQLNTFNAEPDLEADYYVYLTAASWCGACRQVLPKIVKEYKAMQNAGVEVIFISQDKTKKAAEKYLKKCKADFPAVHYAESGVSRLPGYEKLGYIPAAIFVDADGKPIKSGNGAITLDWKNIISK